MNWGYRMTINVWELENTGSNGYTTNLPDLDDFLEGSSIPDIKEKISVLRLMFGENFEKLDEWEKAHTEKAYLSLRKKGKCRCGSCLDIYEWWVCESR